MPSGGNWKELFHAACEGNLELVRYHAAHGVDIDYAHPEFLSTPLVACILARQEAVAHFLVDSGANIHRPSEFDDGMNPLQAAVSVGMESVAARLRDLGDRQPHPPAGAEVNRPWWRRLLQRAAAAR